MLYLTCTMISSVDLAHYGVSRAKDWVSVDCGTIIRYLISYCNILLQTKPLSLDSLVIHFHISPKHLSAAVPSQCIKTMISESRSCTKNIIEPQNLEVRDV